MSLTSVFLSLSPPLRYFDKSNISSTMDSTFLRQSELKRKGKRW